MTVAEYWQKFGPEIKKRIKEEEKNSIIANDALALYGIKNGDAESSTPP